MAPKHRADIPRPELRPKPALAFGLNVALLMTLSLAAASTRTATADLLIQPRDTNPLEIPARTRHTPEPFEPSGDQNSPEHYALYARPHNETFIGVIGTYTIVCAYSSDLRVTGQTIDSHTQLTGYTPRTDQLVPSQTPDCLQPISAPSE